MLDLRNAALIDIQSGRNLVVAPSLLIYKNDHALLSRRECLSSRTDVRPYRSASGSVCAKQVVRSRSGKLTEAYRNRPVASAD